ncbi:hypothetical protein CPB86DRAFT_479639 [Serendipita vermifera]|nr:hypothetical protein CPB86DRAFT_479639 [Serendipita vermifera]
MPPHAAPAPDLDDAFVLIVSFAVVAGLTFFVVVQAIGVLREMMDRDRDIPLAQLPVHLKDKLLNKHRHQRCMEEARLLPGGYEFPSYHATDMHALPPISSTVHLASNERISHWLGPQHRCQFTLSPEGYNSDSDEGSDDDSTLTRSSRSNSMSSDIETVVGRGSGSGSGEGGRSGKRERVCVVYDDTLEDSEDDDEEDEEIVEFKVKIRPLTRRDHRTPLPPMQNRWVRA